MKINLNSSNPTLKKPIFLLMLLGAIALPSCGAVPTGREVAMSDRAPATEEARIAAPAPTAQSGGAVNNMPGELQGFSGEIAQADTSISQTAPQLIKKASMNVQVEAISDSVEAVFDLVKQQRGDLLNFEDSKPQSANTKHLVSMQLRVPQQKLESTIDAIAELGIVLNRSITAEDVSDQLIDNEARLTNLRKQEQMVLKIMERSGSVGDVLNAARELGNIREQIERLDAVQKNLKNQVAYSTIYLTLEAPATAVEIPARPLGAELKETWENATEAVGSVAVGSLKLAIYLLAFSPILLVLGAGAFLGYNRIVKQKEDGSSVNP